MLFAIRDATGTDYCVTIADADYLPAFRKHAAWWRRYVRTPHGQAAYRNTLKGAPCFPTRIIMEG